MQYFNVNASIDPGNLAETLKEGNIDKGTDSTFKAMFPEDFGSLEDYVKARVGLLDGPQGLSLHKGPSVKSDDQFEDLGDVNLEGEDYLDHVGPKMKERLARDEELRSSIRQAINEISSYLNQKEYRTEPEATLEESEPGSQETLRKIRVKIDTVDPDQLIEVKKKLREITEEFEGEKPIYTHVDIERR